MSNILNTLSKNTVDRTTFSSGLMPVEASKKFIQMIFESTPLLQAIRTIPMSRDKQILAGILENKGQSRFVGVNNTGNQGLIDTEDQSAYRRSMNAYSFELDTKELSLSRTISNKVLTDNIEGLSLGEIIAKNLSEMLRVDIEDSAINSKLIDPNQNITATASTNSGSGTTIPVGAVQPVGFPVDGSNGHGFLKITKAGVTELITYTKLALNTGVWEFQGCTRNVVDPDGFITSAPVSIATSDTLTWYRHSLHGLMNGWIELFTNPQALTSNIVDGSVINTGHVSFDHLQKMLTVLPKKYRTQDLVYIMSMSQLDAYRTWLMTNHSLAFGQQIIGDSSFAPTLGHKVITPVDFPNDKILLTNPKNLILGIYQDIKMRKITAETDTKLADIDSTYWNLRMRLGYGVEKADGGVLLTGLV